MKQITDDDIMQWDNLVKLVINKHFYANDIFDIEDLHNMGLVAVWKALKNYNDTVDKGKGKAKLKTYMYRTIYNNLSQAIRMKDCFGRGEMRKLTTSLDIPSGEDSNDTLLNTIPSDIDIQDETESDYYIQRNKLYSVINNMSDKDRELIQLRVNGLKLREIADITNIKRTTLSMKYKRIINDIKNNIEKDGIYEKDFCGNNI